uniref:Abnormal spindle microtubule assembly n=1 Tax=Echeneis naucrates TaxID=173247 RepID=A0A665TFE6_ECHNA
MGEFVTSTRTGLLDFSPVRRDNANKENDVPTLSLIQFSKAPFVSFGTVKLGTSKSTVLRIENPTDDAEAEVTVERIPSNKGFSVDYNTFTIQPDGSFSLTVTWTPAEEGGVRELIIFNANGVLKHQAVLLGRAEAPKKKKKSLWDTIKNKKQDERVTAPRGKKTGPPLKMAANKTFQVSRKPQYKRDKPRSPLTSLNEGKAVRERTLTKHCPIDDHPGKIVEENALTFIQRQKATALSEQENVYQIQRNSPVVLLVPSAKLMNSGIMSASPDTLVAPSLKSSGASSVKTVKVVAVAQSKLTFIKPTQTAIPRHPMPFAAKNMFYDERWIEKQERGFTWWINYVLTPDDFKVNTEVAKVSAVSLAVGNQDNFNVPKAPTKEEMSFSTYTARRKLNRLRRSACQLFTSEPMVRAIQKLELEVEAKRLLIRKDRHLWKDIGERRKVLNWLLSYNPLWLRIGLETIYGELISLESNSDALGLAMFIMQRLLWNPDIAAEFRHAKVPHLYKDGHEEALSRFTLKKLLLLVCFLDKAKESRLIEHDPCLFCVDAEFKASKDLLLAFSRDFLSGEGILPRHLGYLGLPVSHVQMPLDEFNFAVKNLAVDLKCGIRLVRVMELLIQDWGLSAKLRLPAISRLQKVHNVDIALQVLKSKGVDLRDEHGNFLPEDIVDGHREKTLSLLWKIIFTFHVILDEDQLREEISFLKRALKTKRRLMSLRADRGLQLSPTKTQVPYEHSSTKITLLMEWVRAVCDFYNLRVENFTVTFSDGRILCYLIHHYHPGLLPEEALSLSTTQTVECSPRGRLELTCSASDSDTSFDSLPTDLNGTLEFKELLENEKRNFRLVNTAVAFLGGVPAMINPADMSNTIPNEKVVMSYLTFLCARLLDLRNETRAARVIQGAWRKYRLKKDLQNMAAVKIQLAVRNFLQKRRAKKKNQAAIIIQALWRGYVVRRRQRLKREAKLRALQDEAATTIQAQWRMFSVMRNYQRLRYYTIVVQAQWRMQNAASAYGKIYRAATVLQKHSRAWAAGRRARESYQLLRNAVVTLQRGYRRWKACKTEKENCAAKVIQSVFKKWYREKMAKKTTAAVRIQSWYRMQRSLHQYNKIKRIIQAAFRRNAARRRYLALRKIQAYYRKHKAQAEYRSKKAAALVIQRHYRANVAGKEMREAYLCKRAACVAIQAGFRGMQVRTELKKKNQAATIIQSSVRMFLCRKRYFLLQSAAIITQSRFRALLLCRAQQNEYRNLKQAAIKIQALYRGRRVREVLKKKHNAAIAIQAQFRMYRIRMGYLATKCATIIIQERYRAKMLRDQQLQRYRAIKSATVVIQAAYRSHRARRKVAEMHQAATIIQRKFLTIRDRRRFVAMKAAALVCQQRYRAVTMARKRRLQYLSKRRAVICLQAAYRGYVVRKQLRLQHTAAVKIQSHFRMYQQRFYYKRLCWAANVSQARYRANKDMREAMQALSVKRNAAIVLQAAFRGMKCRRIMAERHRASSIIQRAYKAHCERSGYLALKSSVLTIQRRYRATVAAKGQMQEYQKMRRAAFVLQAACRGWQVRKEVAHWHQAATVIQSVFRKHRREVKFQAMRLSAIIIQRHYRAHVLQRRDRESFLKMRHSAVVLQAAFRGYHVRTDIAKKHQAATIIQANFKRHKQQAAFRRQHWAACVLQQRFRAQRQRSIDRKHYQEVRKAVVHLQAALRGVILRRVLQQRHRAASVIQRAYRAYTERKQYLKLKQSVLVIQRKYRATVEAKTQRTSYLEMRRAVISLQAAYRGHQVRRKVAFQHQAATLIQSLFRKHRREVKFQAMRLSAIIIQRHYRAHVLQRRDRESFLKMRHSAVVLQAAFRGYHVRTDIAKKHQAATIIQANFKRHKQQVAFRRQHWAACVLQQRFRAQRQRNLQLKCYHNCRDAAIVLQAAFRGMKSRQTVKKMHHAASVIQRAYKAHRQRKQYLKLKQSVLAIQRRYRATVAAKGQMQEYQKMCRAAFVLQAACRGWQVRKEVAHWHQAATVIQSVFRKHRREVKFQAMRLSAIIIQRHYRAHVLQRRDRESFLKMRHSAVVLQAAFRGYHVRTDIAKKHQAATIIQANFKRHKQQAAFRRQHWAACVLQQRFRAQRQRSIDRKHYQEVRKAVVHLQAALRGVILRRVLQQRHRAASVIQRAYRAYTERKQYLKLKQSVLVIQRKYRATVEAKTQRTSYLEMRRAVISLQAAYRGHQVRRKVAFQHQAATLIQSLFRKHREEVKFKAMRLSAIIIQRYYRSCILQKQERGKLLKLKQSAIILQAAFRGWCVRREITRQHQAAIVIQLSWRSLLQRQIFQRKREAAVTLQRRFRAARLGKSERNDYIRKRQIKLKLKETKLKILWTIKAAKAVRRLRFTSALFHHLSAMKIQRALRAHWALEAAKRQIHSVITIQRWVRSRQQRRRYLEDRRKVVTAQRAIKCWLARRHRAASIIQQAVRKFLLLKRQTRVQQGIVKAQALWRGHRSRRLNDNPKVVKLRHRLRQVSAGVRDEDKLCNKTSSALDHLLRYKHFSYILEALKNLEIATRLSPECCERLVDSGATNVIFTLIRCCNRSVPCMDVITFSIQILLNLSKYHKTIEAVFSVENSVETLLDLLQRYREKAGDKVAEKGGSIFTKACFLLNNTKNCCFYFKMNASINGSFFVQATPRKTPPAPKFAPDWVLRKDKLKDIVDPLRAIQMVAETLTIVL